MPGWLRNGLIAGVASAIATLLLGLLRAAVKSDYCQAGIIGTGHPSGVDITLNLSGLALLLVLAGVAGRQTAKAGPSKGNAGLAGLVTGATSGVGTLALNVLQFNESTTCMVRGGIAGPGMDMRPTLLVMAVVAIAIGAGLAVIAGYVGVATARRA